MKWPVAKNESIFRKKIAPSLSFRVPRNFESYFNLTQGGLGYWSALSNKVQKRVTAKFLENLRDQQIKLNHAVSSLEFCKNQQKKRGISIECKVTFLHEKCINLFSKYELKTARISLICSTLRTSKSFATPKKKKVCSSPRP